MYILFWSILLAISGLLLFALVLLLVYVSVFPIILVAVFLTAENSDIGKSSAVVKKTTSRSRIFVLFGVFSILTAWWGVSLNNQAAKGFSTNLDEETSAGLVYRALNIYVDELNCFPLTSYLPEILVLLGFLVLLTILVINCILKKE